MFDGERKDTITEINRDRIKYYNQYIAAEHILGYLEQEGIRRLGEAIQQANKVEYLKGKFDYLDELYRRWIDRYNEVNLIVYGKDAKQLEIEILEDN